MAPEPSLRTKLVIRSLVASPLWATATMPLRLPKSKALPAVSSMKASSRLPSMSDSERVASALPTWLPAKVVALIS